jgi:predicted DNA binding CopG/RHH family protein
MAATANRTSQIHVRVSPGFKKAVKIFCVRQGLTEQAWISELIEAELKNQAPDLLSEAKPNAIKSSKTRR